MSNIVFPVIPDDLSDLTADELQQLIDEAVRLANEIASILDTPEDSAAYDEPLAKLASDVDRVRAEVTGREEAAGRVQEQIASISAGLESQTSQTGRRPSLADMNRRAP